MVSNYLRCNQHREFGANVTALMIRKLADGEWNALEKQFIVDADL